MAAATHFRLLRGLATAHAGCAHEPRPTRPSTPESGNHIPIRLVQARPDPLVPFPEGERVRDLFREAGYSIVLDDFPPDPELRIELQSNGSPEPEQRNPRTQRKRPA